MGRPRDRGAVEGRAFYHRHDRRAAARSCLKPGERSANDRVLLIATRSEDKVREIVPLLRHLPVRILSLSDAGIPLTPAEESIERFDTFEENAAAKARYFFIASDGMPTVADDSGLTVDALEGAPGVHSKRWANRPELEGTALDEANNLHLLEALQGSANRRARYVCVAAFADAATTIAARGETTGEITPAARGSAGFGYDPYFLSDDLGCTFGEAAPAEKSRVSHRGRAFRALAKELCAVFSD
ncbi:MAG: non-canonical purine NTP pyrophosphatase [Gemmatimonadaceae bacterium]|nr:non-canonical purine NTP pyrophosphatase [Gemmatimonadaceae bacterium]